MIALAAVIAALAASPRATPVDLLWPVALDPGISSSFCDYRDGRFHAGIDVRTYGREGIACLAVGDGYVSRVRASSRGYGKALHLTLDSGVQVVYAHLAEFTPALEDTLWIEGTCGVILAWLAAGRTDRALREHAQLAPLLRPDGFPYVTHDDPANEMRPWTSVASTGWFILCRQPNGFWGVANPEPDQLTIRPNFGRVKLGQLDDAEYKSQGFGLATPWKTTAGPKRKLTYDFTLASQVDVGQFRDFVGAVVDNVEAESLTRVLYPDDSTAAGRTLRFLQQYFLVSCSIQDLVARFRQTGLAWSALPDRVAIQMNDTHPALSVAELMRILLDEARLGWDEAWDLTVRSLAYTNHTLLPEALEKWPVDLFKTVIPRHLEIILEVNRRFLDDVRKRYPGDGDRVRRMSLIEEGETRRVRMAHLAVVGSHSTNGVAEIHSDLLRTRVLRDCGTMGPETSSG